MSAYLIRRLLISIPVVLGVTFIVFALVSLAPGDPINLLLASEKVTPEMAERVREYYGLDKPWYSQYATYLGHLLRGDMGYSITTRTPVSQSIKRCLPNTLQLTAASMIVALLIAIPVGVLSATHRNSFLDYVSLTGSMLGVSMPNFWLGLLLLLLLGLQFKVLPIWGIGRLSRGLWDVISHLIMPSLTLGTSLAGLLTRLTRSSVLEVLSQDYISTARAKGLAEWAVRYRHALRNAIIPVLTAAGLQFGALLGGAVIVETIFAWPGMGRLAYGAIQQRDLPMIQGTTLVFAICFIAVTLLVDVLYVFIDPRIRYD
ncbi:ABC transporter permease [Candidatus Bipolaricaulota bacterium]|nr:ABC transporter permease [Candidatus Bipolaricaulota bacterium]